MSTNKWLDELKKIQEDISPAMEFTGKEAYIPTTIETYALFWYLFKMDRLIEIVEVANDIRYALCQSEDGSMFVQDQRFIEKDLNKLAKLFSDEWEPNGD